MKINTLIIGSGAAGLAAAVQLNALGQQSLALFTEGLHCGTSINTGSDKQTYYKLSLSGKHPDSPDLMAEDLYQCGSMHGDLALVEAATSAVTFANLIRLGVQFPHDLYGRYTGYQTDHDLRGRASSCGPYTSRDMCLAMIKELKLREIPVFEDRVAISLLCAEEGNQKRCAGAVFINRNTGELEYVFARNVIFAVGGPGGLYADSVYPLGHTGAIGIALEAGARARSLPESQFGLASLKFRWNVSGSYMQVLPRFVSCDSSGRDEREFLREYFPSDGELCDAIFLKGYQWPFSCSHLPGSSLIDLFVYRETRERKRRVFLDYRQNPTGFDWEQLAPESRQYLKNSNATGSTPLERLQQLNAPAIALYRDHDIDLATEMLEIAVCAQHNNGGLAGNIWYESENLPGLFPIGEVNGSHGITRPGGSALNAGQCGALRAAQYIAASSTEDAQEFPALARDFQNRWQERCQRPGNRDWEKARKVLQRRMSDAGAFLREAAVVSRALAESEEQWKTSLQGGLGGLSVNERIETLRNEQLLVAQQAYLSAILKQIESGTGSRGGAMIIDKPGNPLHPKLSWHLQPENPAFRNQVLETEFRQGIFLSEWQPCRPLPDNAGWFENVWNDFRSGKIYQTKN